MEPPLVAASYERVSTRMQGQFGFSLGAQHHSLEEFAASQGWTLPEHLRFRDGEDENASGADWDLPGLTAMLEAAQRREFHVLVVPDLDRFARSMVKGLVLEEQLKSYGVRVVYQRVPVEDTPEGRLLKHQLLSFAEFEREKTTLRTTMGRRRKAQLGQVVGAELPPFGYRFTYALRNNVPRACGLEPDPVTAPIARRILRSLKTRSSVDIMDELNAEGVAPPAGHRRQKNAASPRWWYKSIQRMGRNPVYAGTWLYGKHDRPVKSDDESCIAVPVPPLISRHEWDEIQEALDRRKTRRRGRIPQAEDPYLLRGLLDCGHCHGPLQSAPNSGIRYYRCGLHNPSHARHRGKPTCELPDLYAADLEAELWRLLSTTLLDPEYLSQGLTSARSQRAQGDQLRQERLAALDTEVARQRQRLDSIASRFADAGGGEVLAALMRQARDIETLIERLKEERAALTAAHAEGLGQEEADAIEAFAAEVRTGIDAATPAERRHLYDLIHIRGKAFLDPDGILLGRKHRFRVEWQTAIPLLHSGSRLRKPVIQ